MLADRVRGASSINKGDIQLEVSLSGDYGPGSIILDGVRIYDYDRDGGKVVLTLSRNVKYQVRSDYGRFSWNDGPIFDKGAIVGSVEGVLFELDSSNSRFYMTILNSYNQPTSLDYLRDHSRF